MAVHVQDPRIEDLLGALGIKPERCLGFTIDVRPGNVVHVDAEILLEKDEIQTLTHTIKRHYKLVPLEDGA